MAIFRYQCLITKQQVAPEAPTFCLFHAPVGEILQWADIKRLEEEPGAPERPPAPRPGAPTSHKSGQGQSNQALLGHRSAQYDPHVRDTHHRYPAGSN